MERELLPFNAGIQKHSTNYVFFPDNFRPILDKIEVPFPIYTNIHHISCGVSTGISGKYFAKVFHFGKVAPLKMAYLNFKNYN